MIICFSCEKPTRAHLYYDRDEALCRNCWSTRIVRTTEISVVERTDGSTRVLHRTTRGRHIPITEERRPRNVKNLSA